MLQNYQYDAIMREYSRRKATGIRLAQARRQEVARRLPRIEEIDAEVAGLGAGAIRSLFSGSPQEAAHVKEKIARLSQERKSLLTRHGYPEDYLETPYTCPLCQDTGYIGREKCSCFRNAEISLLYSQSNIHEILGEESFANFSFDYYSDKLIDETSGLDARTLAKRAYDAAKRFVLDFDRGPHNLLFFGSTGVGKTFLSRCIAHELLSTAHCVIYFSSHELFEKLASYAFGREEHASSEDIMEADLLIIDDLGTEMTNSFVSSQLFLCVNERILRRKSTIISTNLSQAELAATYTERTFSRIIGSYDIYKLIGNDIRLQKRFA